MMTLFARLFRAAPWVVFGVLIAALLGQHRTIVIEREVNREFRQLATDASGAAKLLSVADARTAFTRVTRDRDDAKSALTQTVASYRVTAAKARANDLAHARAVETAQTTITKETTHALTRQLADARAAADRHVGLHADPTSGPDRGGPGGGGAARLPALAGAPGGAAGAGQAAELDDTRVCAANTVKAQGWMDWWTAVAAIRR